jgi:hypothetical protein
MSNDEPIEKEKLEKPKSTGRRKKKARRKHEVRSTRPYPKVLLSKALEIA